MPTEPSLGETLKAARAAAGLSLRDVERLTGVRSGHLSQIETKKIRTPDMSILWDLAATYDVDFGRLLALAGYAGGEGMSGRQRHRTTVALRAMTELSPAEQEDVLGYMARLRARRDE